jgi:hypothetical protein
MKVRLQGGMTKTAEVKMWDGRKLWDADMVG